MARLPTVGGDNSNWGTILNEYLSVEHNPDGSLKLRTDNTFTPTVADGSITASKLSSSVNNYLASAQTAVQSVNGKTGQAVTLAAADISGVATLTGGTLTSSQVPSSVASASDVLDRLKANGTAAGNNVWQASKVYAVNDIVIAPASRLLVRCKTAHTAGATYSSANWEPCGYADYDVLSPPRSIQDYVNTLWSRAHGPLQPGVATTWLASGFSLTTELGSSFQEYEWNHASIASKVRKIGINGFSISVASTTVEGNNANGVSSAARAPGAIEFDTDADSFVFSFRANSATAPRFAGIWVHVDGRPISANMLRDTAGNTTTIRGLKVVLPGGNGRTRRIKIDFQAVDWRSIAIPAAPKVITAATVPSDRKKIAFVGNSWIQGDAGHTTEPHSIAATLSRVLDSDYINAGIGGTGYVNAGTAEVFGGTNRLAALTALAPDLIIVFGAQNDDGFSGLQAAATAYFSAIASALPASKVVVIGPESVNYNSLSNRAANVTALQAAAAAASNVIGGYVINPYGEKWMTGSGRIGTQNGDGIADWGMVADAIHPTVLGSAYYARRIAEHIVYLALRAGKMNGTGFSVADLIS